MIRSIEKADKYSVELADEAMIEAIEALLFTNPDSKHREPTHVAIYDSDGTTYYLLQTYNKAVVKLLRDNGYTLSVNGKGLETHSTKRVTARALTPTTPKRTRSVEILNESWAKSIEKQIAELREKVEGK